MTILGSNVATGLSRSGLQQHSLNIINVVTNLLNRQFQSVPLVQQQQPTHSQSQGCKMSSATIPALALLHDKSLAEYLHPVCMELASQVAQSCSKVTRLRG